jgi:hypothetical protein
MEVGGQSRLFNRICYSLARFSQPGESEAAIANNVMIRLDFVELPNCEIEPAIITLLPVPHGFLEEFI